VCDGTGKPGSSDSTEIRQGSNNTNSSSGRGGGS